MRVFAVRLLILLVALLIPGPATGTEGVTGFGVTPSVGAVGDGRLTAQVSPEGTLTCMRWPNATFYEHVKYKSGFWSRDAENAWVRPHFGAGSSDGMFAGIRYHSGVTVEVVWLRDAQPKFRYAGERTNRLVATYVVAAGAAKGLTVEEETFNVPDKPFLVRSYRLLDNPTGVTETAIVAFANPALRNEHGTYAPNGDYDFDDRARFATFALPSRNAILSALPRGGNIEEVTSLAGAARSEVDAFVDRRLAEWDDGIFMAQGPSVAMTAYQVGTDSALRATGPRDAYLDAADGFLEGNGVVTHYETTAMVFPLGAEPVAWYAAFGTTASDALDALKNAQVAKPQDHAKQSNDWWEALLENVILPSEKKAAAFSLRALISLRTGYDPESGAIVASTSCQPPYNVDWPRDGAFFQFVLNMNGLNEMADKHARFYPNIQYTESGEGMIRRSGELDLVGRFPMNAFADFVPGGPIDWEIDNTGFALWLYRVHAGFLSQTDPESARDFLEDIAFSARLAADLLTVCKDAGNDLQCPANEDDNVEFTQTLHGALTTWLGLKSAAEIFEALGDHSLAMKYRLRVNELDKAIRKNFDPSKGADVHAQQLSWSYWPGRFWSKEDLETNDFAAVGLGKAIDKKLLSPDTLGTQYLQKATIALLVPPLRSDQTSAKAAEANAKYVNALARQDTLHMAENTAHYDIDGDGEKEWINHVATPHIWAQALVYLSLIAAERPELLELPPIAITPPPSVADGGGCSCSTTGGKHAGTNLPVAAFIVAVYFFARRRR